jgi:hypothetical protein
MVEKHPKEAVIKGKSKGKKSIGQYKCLREVVYLVFDSPRCDTLRVGQCKRASLSSSNVGGYLSIHLYSSILSMVRAASGQAKFDVVVVAPHVWKSRG